MVKPSIHLQYCPVQLWRVLAHLCICSLWDAPSGQFLPSRSEIAGQIAPDQKGYVGKLLWCAHLRLPQGGQIAASLYSSYPLSVLGVARRFDQRGYCCKTAVQVLCLLLGEKLDVFMWLELDRGLANVANRICELMCVVFIYLFCLKSYKIFYMLTVFSKSTYWKFTHLLKIYIRFIDFSHF